MTYIERIQVEADGFLSNLDIELTRGLNVIIGARGTGKTSIIELVRFALGAGAFTKEAGERGEQQARAILDGGAVTVTLRDGDTRLVATRSASMSSPRFDSSKVTCTVLAQNEIESVGAQRTGRLMLLDRFRPNRDNHARELAELDGSLRGITREIADLALELDAVTELTTDLNLLQGQLTASRQAQLGLLETSEATAADQARLGQLQAASQAIAVRAELINEAVQQAEATSSLISTAIDVARAAVPEWASVAGADVLAQSRALQEALIENLDSAKDAGAALLSSAEAARSDNNRRRSNIEAESRELRQSLELLQAGMSQAAQRVAELEERVGQASATTARLQKRRLSLIDLVIERDELYARRSEIEQEIFDERLQVAAHLNERLGPQIRVGVRQSAGLDDYRGAIINAIRGSGLHYNTLGPLIASKVGPLELVTWAESRDAGALAEVTGITQDRAAVVLSSLREGTPNLITSSVPDEVDLFLLDGPDYKSTERLSIGQRCTVVLPLLLGHVGDPLLLDQPEDHLDNAFVADTLVKSLRERSGDDQYIFASHNANIPVLADAEHVVVMGSDGDRGYVVTSGGLASPEIVASIEGIMEGGVAAFQQRSAFYATHPAS